MPPTDARVSTNNERTHLKRALAAYDTKRSVAAPSCGAATAQDVKDLIFLARIVVVVSRPDVRARCRIRLGAIVVAAGALLDNVQRAVSRAESVAHAANGARVIASDNNDIVDRVVECVARPKR